MKLQKILASAYAQEETDLGKDLNKVMGIQKQISTLERSRTTWEEHLGREIIEIIKSDTRYPKFQKLLNTVLISGPKTKGLMFACIAMQIAESVAKYYDKDPDFPNGRINWGFEIYDLPYKEMERIIAEELTKTNINKLFDGLNSWFNEYDVHIIVHPGPGELSLEYPIKLTVKIFPD